MRVVIDTNVFLSAILGRALNPILGYWQKGRFTLIVSDAIVGEYYGVLSRPKFNLTSDTIDPIMAMIFHQAEFVTPETFVDLVVADPSDNKFLEAALAGQAEYIVSGDNHLLEIEQYQAIEILTPREFLNRMEA